MVVDERFTAAAVVRQVRGGVAELLAFERVDFGQPLYLSDVYAAVESVPGVAVPLTITRFRRRTRGTRSRRPSSPGPGCRRSASCPRSCGGRVDRRRGRGRIELGEFEIPVLGALDVRSQP